MKVSNESRLNDLICFFAKQIIYCLNQDLIISLIADSSFYSKMQTVCKGMEKSHPALAKQIDSILFTQPKENEDFKAYNIRLIGKIKELENCNQFAIQFPLGSYTLANMLS